MPVKSRKQEEKSVSRIEWRLQDTATGKIHNRIYPSEERAHWHARKFNTMGLMFNSPVRTQVVKVRSTYLISLVQDKKPHKIKVIT